MNAKNGINIEIYNKKFRKSPNMWTSEKTKTLAYTNQWVEEEILSKLENSFRWMRNKVIDTKTYDS